MDNNSYISLNNKKLYRETNISKKHLENLASEKIVEIYPYRGETYFLRKDLEIIRDVEFDLRHNWKSINTFYAEDFRTQISFNKQIDALRYMLKECDLKVTTQLINYRGTTYINKDLIITFTNYFIPKKKAMNLLQLNEVLYLKFINKLGIKEMILTYRSIYLSNSEFKKLSSYIKTYIKGVKEKNSSYDWYPADEITKVRKYQRFGIKEETLLKSCVKFNIKYIKIKGKPVYIDLIKLNKITNELDKLNNNYYTAQQTLEKLSKSPKAITSNFTKTSKLLISFLEKTSINYKTTDYIFNYNKLYIDKQQLDNFIKHYKTANYIMEKYNINKYNFNTLLKNNNVRVFRYSKYLKFYNLEDFHSAQQPNHDFNAKKESFHKFYTAHEVKNRFNFSNFKLLKITRENGLKTIFYEKTTYYEKEEIHNLLERMEYIRENFVPSQRLAALNYRSNYHGGMKDIEGAIKAKGIDRYCFSESYQILIPINFYQDFKYNVELRQHRKSILDSVDYSNAFDAFTSLIEMQNIKFSSNSKETETYWILFVKERLANSNALDHGRSRVRDLVTSTKLLFNFCMDDELSQKHSNDIKFVLFAPNISSRCKQVFYIFLSQLYMIYMENNYDIKYKPEYLPNVYLTSPKKNNINKEESYHPRIFLELIEYCKSPSHKRKAIEDSIKLVKNDSPTTAVDYAYSWLYVLLHLNIAWRHNDVISLRMINIDELKINSLNDISNNQLSQNQINYIINALYTNEKFVSKTDKVNNFFINDELKEPLAYAYIICHLLNLELYPLRNNIINFSNKQNKFLITQHRFFETFKHDINFKNRKMNKTLITITQKMMQEKGEGLKGLQISKLLRAHTSIDTTQLYVDLTDDDMNELSQHLFERGIFGFIPKLLSEIIIGKSSDRKVTTNNIHRIKDVFKDIYNIEVSVGFLNTLANEKTNLIDTLVNEGIENAQTTLNKLNLNLLPGKSEHFQCLLANTGCVKPSFDCKHCIYAIPNRIALNSVIESLIKNVDILTNSFECYTKTERIKITNIIFRELNLINDSFEYFGQEEVLSMFKYKSESYLTILKALDVLNENNNLLDYVKDINFTSGVNKNEG